MRPETHREQIPEKRCENCKFSELVHYKQDLLCFYGDNIKINKWHWKDSETINTDVKLDGEDVGLMEGDEYSKVWGGRVVDYTDICDEWQPK